MADFQRKQIPFLHKGMNWNSPPEKLADGQVEFAKNVRIPQQGTIGAAHGFTQRFYVPGRGFLHSMARLNILNPDLDSRLARTYVLGADYQLNVFQDATTLANNTINPVITPQGLAGFSTNPLSIVDMQPYGAAAAWKYIGDSQQMVTVGYYPPGPDSTGAMLIGDIYNSQMARCLTVGLDPPVFNASALQVYTGQSTPDGQPGNLTGSYQWAFAFRRLPTGARSNPSAATRDSAASPASVLVNGYAALTLPDVPRDPQKLPLGQPDFHVTVDVYRFGGVVNRWALVGSGPGGSVFIDNVPDETLLAAPAPSQITDASTGLTRFNVYRPFVTADISRGGVATVFLDSNGATRLQVQSGNNFNPQWLAGSTIQVGATGSVAARSFTIYQVLSDTVLELAGDCSTSLPAGGAHNWSTPAGTLQAGQPLPHIWGPYGIGQSGSYIFGCGDPNAKGTLYWTNGNDPDSTDIVNNIIVTSPSEKLVTGCVFAGQPYAWSTERQFQIFPSLTVFGQFTTQEVAGAKGVWLEWSLSVQSNGFADQSVTWRGKDGIYDMSAGGGLQRLTDPLFPFFPHDNQPGFAPETIVTQIGSEAETPEHIGNLDDTQPQYHRTTWFHGLLFYDFVALTTNPSTGVQQNTYSTLVWDTVNIPGGGWVSLDQPFPTTAAPVCRCVEIGANDPNFDAAIEPGPIYGPMARGGNLLVLRSIDPTGTEPHVYDYYGYTRGFKARVITKAEDMGDSRAPKVWGDYWVQCTPINNIVFTPLYDFNNGPLLPSTAVAGALPGDLYTFDFKEFLPSAPAPGGMGQGFLNPTLGLDVQWIAADGQFTEQLNQWQPSFIPKPEFVEYRATDPNDAGATQAKYLMGANIEANTLNQVSEVGVIIDGVFITTLHMQHNYQAIKPYAWEPVAGYEFQVQLVLGPGTNALQLFKINWIFDVWPDAIARKYSFMNLGTSGDKYIKGIVMPMETGGQPASVTLWGDDTNSIIQWDGKTTPPLKKTGMVLDLPSGPFTAHEIQFATLTDSRIWPGEAKIDFDPWPESSTDASSFMDLGYNGAKFVQGAVIPIETGGKATSLTIRNECSQYVTLPAKTTPKNCKQSFAFSFSPCYNPASDVFIAHELQVQPGSDARIWYNEIRWIWEPMPELVPSWVTQPTDLDLPGWHSLRDCYIAYMGGTGAPTLYITTEYGTLQYKLDAVTDGQYVRCYRVLAPQKAKWRSFRVESCGGMRLFLKDCEVRAKAWGDTGPYKSFQPFGDLSRTNGGARI